MSVKSFHFIYSNILTWTSTINHPSAPHFSYKNIEVEMYDDIPIPVSAV